MKTFYTSNYEKNGTNPKAIAISEPSLVPSDYDGKRSESLAPTSELLEEYHAQKITHDVYAGHYKALLGSRNITPQTIVDSTPDGSVFLCFDYEDGDPSICHRFILSEWLNESGLATVTEI
jgi:uncharacterized protein YeaO (DUF488 family)